jgi:hypothetical protein
MFNGKLSHRPIPHSRDSASLRYSRALSIRDIMLVELTRRFGRESFHAGDLAETLAVFPAKHTEVGDVMITDDGDEVTLSIGTITHGHFNAFDLSSSDAAQEIVTRVGEFLEALFAGRVLLWRSETGLSGGWRWMQQDESPAPHKGVRKYTWNGPI